MRTLLPWAREFNSRCVSRVLGPLKGLDCKGGLVGPGALYLNSWAFELDVCMFAYPGTHTLFNLTQFGLKLEGP